MRILYISQYFPPEVGATQTRAYEMARNWVRLGHQVTMLTEFPNHPSGIIPKSYKRKLYEIADLEGIKVIRVWVKTSAEKNFRTRMLFYITFMFNAFLAGIFLAKGKYDLIYASSPPLFVGGAAVSLNFIKRIPMVFEVRDLWPESAIALGELHNQKAIDAATWLEEACYQKAHFVIVVTQGFYDRLIERGIRANKLLIIPNGANVELFTFKPSGRERIRNELGMHGKFLVIYAGILGLAQGLEVIIEAARLLHENPHIHFLIIGEGPKKAELMSLAASYSLQNLTFLPEKPWEQIPDYLSASDLAVIPLKKADIFKGTLPSKLFDAWSCERPVVISIDGEARNLVEGVGGGIYCPPEEAKKLAEAIVHLMENQDERNLMGKQGRKYTLENRSRTALAEKLISFLEANLH